MAETKKKSNPTTPKRVFIKLNIEETRNKLDISPLQQRKKSVDLSSPKQFDSNSDSLHFSTFQSPVKQVVKGKPPLSPNIVNLSGISGISSISSKIESPQKTSNKTAKLRELSMKYVLSKEKFIEKVLHENSKLGVCN